MTNNFNPDQKRGGAANAGNWTAYENSLPESELPDLPVDAPVKLNGRAGKVLSVDNGTHMVLFENGDMTLASKRDLGLTTPASARVKLTSIAGLADTLQRLDPHRAKQIVGLHKQINEGGFGAVRDVAWFDIRRIEAFEADVASEQGRDSSDLDEVNPVRAAAEAVYGDEFYRLRNAEFDEDHGAHLDAMSVFHDAAVAVTYRDYVGSERFPGFTQEAYDHMTRPVRQALGPVHPDDEAEPASWSKRYGCVTPNDHRFVGGDDPYCSECGKQFPNIGGEE